MQQQQQQQQQQHDDNNDAGEHEQSVVLMEGVKPRKRLESNAHDSIAGKMNCSNCKGPTMKDVENLVPFIKQMKAYDWKESVLGDLVAGLTVGVMLVPQGMAYSLLATLPPEFGLYSAVAPILVYAVFGTSRQLAVGPVAIVSLLVAEALEGLNAHTPEEKIAFAALLSFFVGIISLFMGIFRAGLLSTFLSHSVLVGFTAGASVVIALSQLKHLLGFPIPRFSYPIQTLFYALEHIANTNPTTITMGIIAIVLLLLLRHAKRHWTKPIQVSAGEKASSKVKAINILKRVLFFLSSMGALFVVIFGTLASTIMYRDFGYDRSSLPIVGDVPSGFPSPSIPDFSRIGEGFGDIFVAALVISILAFMESYAVADRFARKHDYEIDSNQELLALGLANTVGSFFSAYPVAGGFGRSAVQDSAGAKSTLAAITSALIVLTSLYAFTESFYFMPKVVLASIVFVAVSSLFDFHAVKLAWKINKHDFAVILTTFTATLCLGTEIGLAIGFAASVLLLLQKLAFPHVAVLAPVVSASSGELHYRNITRFPEAKPLDRVLLFRLDAPLNFVNKASFLDKLALAMKQVNFTSASTSLYNPAVILSMEGVSSIDISGLEVLLELQTELNQDGISLVATSVRGPVRDTIEKQNKYLVKHEQPQLLPWCHSLENIEFPSNFQSASIEEALVHLQGKECPLHLEDHVVNVVPPSSPSSANGQSTCSLPTVV